MRRARTTTTIVTALVEIAAGAVAWIAWFAQFRLEYYAHTADAAVPFGYGAIMYFSFLSTLRGLVAGFLVAEGAARLLHAVFTEEPIGFLVPTLVRAVARRVRERRRARVVDRVVRHDDGSVTVEGLARDWTPLSTFLVDERHYTLAQADPSVSGSVTRSGPLRRTI